MPTLIPNPHRGLANWRKSPKWIAQWRRIIRLWGGACAYCGRTTAIRP
jgi:hypothetical protein